MLRHMLAAGARTPILHDSGWAWVLTCVGMVDNAGMRAL